MIVPSVIMMFAFCYSSYVDDETYAFILRKIEKVRETESQWFASLQTIPSGVMIYDTEDHKFTFENKMVYKLLERGP